ncbi:MAG: hypothetical protein GX291_03775 [Tissierellia bacterium]|jgi:hypothetical protein|nr:hypothetical protein [Bacillota bacterium]NLK58376.1 hypothetical protein [Tissierellia bacterium]
MNNHKQIHPEDPHEKDRNKAHPDVPLDENAALHPESPPHDTRAKRDYVAESTVEGDGIYDESLFEEDKDPVPPSGERDTAITPADTQVPATESPQPPRADVQEESTAHNRLERAIEEKTAEPEPVHPHMHDSQDHLEERERQKDKDMQDADVYNVFRRSKYRGDT